MPPDSATVLRCPGCGAPARSGAARCEYCDARLATVSCPACFALLFDAAQFCHQCGARRARVESPERGATACPACRGDMSWVRVGDADFLQCASCDGVWVEAETFERICTDREQQAAVLQRDPAARSAGQERPTAVRYRPCPRCRKLMNRVNFARVSGTVIDVCKGHGTFLDHGELHDIVRFIHDGGLDRARAAERERRVEDDRRTRVDAIASGEADMPLSHEGWTEQRLSSFMAALLKRGD